MEENNDMRGSILIVFTLLLPGCTKDEVNPATDSTVHLAGFVVNSSLGATASYWRDGVHTALTHDSVYSNVNSMYVDRSSVLIGGWRVYINAPPSRAVIWHDGTENVIDKTVGASTFVASRNNNFYGAWYDSAQRWVFSRKDIIQQVADTAYNIGVNGLSLLGDDVYLCGDSEYHDGKPDTKTLQHAQCWKNGQLIFRESALSNAMAIFIYQNDIYMAGYYENGTPFNSACYWKNGQRVDLPGEKAMAMSVFVTDAHVYVAGTIDQQAVYWIDGEAVFLTNGGTFSIANSVFVKGTDVHVAGAKDGYPAYWKNDVRQDIASQERRGQLRLVVVGSN